MHTYVYVVESTSAAIGYGVAKATLFSVARPDFLSGTYERQFQAVQHSDDVDGKWVGRVAPDFRYVAVVVETLAPHLVRKQGLQNVEDFENSYDRQKRYYSMRCLLQAVMIFYLDLSFVPLQIDEKFFFHTRGRRTSVKRNYLIEAVTIPVSRSELTTVAQISYLRWSENISKTFFCVVHLFLRW